MNDNLILKEILYGELSMGHYLVNCPKFQGHLQEESEMHR